MVMRRTICGLIGALSAFSGASAYGKISLQPLQYELKTGGLTYYLSTFTLSDL